MKKILLAEDDPFLIDIYTTKFKEEGIFVDTVTNGKDCLVKLNNQKFDLLILDIVLPDIDGWEILNNIKKEEGTDSFKDMKIVILSNFGEKKDIEKGSRLGANKYFIKAHHTPSEIVAKVKDLLS